MEAIGLNITVSVVTAVLTYLAIEYFKNSGKIRVNVTRSNIGLTMPDKHGGQTPTVDLEQADQLHITLGLNIYNSSNTQKSLRDIGFGLQIKNWGTITIPASVTAEAKNLEITSALYSGQPLSRPLDILNLPPKELIFLYVFSSVPAQKHYKGNILFSLVGKYPNGKKFKAKLVTVDPEHPPLHQYGVRSL
jgi:hypothetical protein